MRLYEELFKNKGELSQDRCVILLGYGGYFEGVKSLGEFSAERIELCFAKRNAVIEGVDLSIGKYCDGDLRIDGKILSFTLDGEGGK